MAAAPLKVPLESTAGGAVLLERLSEFRNTAFSKGFAVNISEKGQNLVKCSPWVFPFTEKIAGFIPFCILETLPRDV